MCSPTRVRVRPMSREKGALISRPACYSYLPNLEPPRVMDLSQGGLILEGTWSFEVLFWDI